MKLQLKTKPELLIFVFLWIFYGCFIRTHDLSAYNLQQMGVDAIVSHGTFTLGHSELPILQPQGDVFSFNERLHAAKQPGQFVVGAMAYAPLKWLGLSYEKDYVSTAAWVTWLSSTSFAALISTLVFYIAFRIWKASAYSSLLSVFTAAFMTPLFAYSGVAHHDVIAAALVMVAFCFYEIARTKSDSSKDSWLDAWFFVGAASGATLFFSMLPALIILAFLFCSLIINYERSKRALLPVMPRNVLKVLFGFALGALPLAFHNWYYFGSPLTQANTAGGYQDTFFAPSLTLWNQHVRDYFGFGPISVFKYVPALMPGGFALVAAFFWAENKRYKPAIIAIGLALCLHLIYVLSIETIGHCQFGPRYLLPTFALLSLTTAPFFDVLIQHQKKAIAILLGLLSALTIGFSGAINLVGAQIGTMQCDLNNWIPMLFWQSQAKDLWISNYPLRKTMVVLFTLAVLTFTLYELWFRRDQKRKSQTEIKN